MNFPKKIPEKSNVFSEKVPRPKIKINDPSEVHGPGYMSDMSLTELNERLKLLQEKNQKQIDKKRSEIIREKQEKENLLQVIDCYHKIKKKLMCFFNRKKQNLF